MTYTSPALEDDSLREMTGFPGIDLRFNSTIQDGDFFALFEEVFPNGFSRFVTDWMIRASRLTVESNIMYDTVGVPYHPSTDSDVRAKLAEGLGKPVLLLFHLEPISYVFHSGNRIRLTVCCAEYATYQHPMYDLSHMPEFTFYHGGKYPSAVKLPMIPFSKPAYTLPSNYR